MEVLAILSWVGFWFLGFSLTFLFQVMGNKIMEGKCEISVKEIYYMSIFSWFYMLVASFIAMYLLAKTVSKSLNEEENIEDLLVVITKKILV